MLQVNLIDGKKLNNFGGKIFLKFKKFLKFFFNMLGFLIFLLNVFNIFVILLFNLDSGTISTY